MENFSIFKVPTTKVKNGLLVRSIECLSITVGTTLTPFEIGYDTEHVNFQ